jgi:hypothetical protein
MGMPVDPIPASADWRAILDLAVQLETAAGDWFAKRMTAVSLDGRLTEWEGVKPFFLRELADVDRSRYQGATLYVGYDDDHLYVAGRVLDSSVVNNHRLNNIWNGDALEVLIDLQPDARPGVPSYDTSCFQFIFSPTSADGTSGVTDPPPAQAGTGSSPTHARCASEWRSTCTWSRSPLRSSDRHGCAWPPRVHRATSVKAATGRRCRPSRGR